MNKKHFFYLMLVAIILTHNCCLFNNNQKYYTKYIKFENQFKSYSDGLKANIGTNDTLYNPYSKIFLEIKFENVSEEEFLFKIPSSYGDELNEGDIKIYINSIKNANIIAIGAQAPLPSPPSKEDFLPLKPNETFEMNKEISGWFASIESDTMQKMRLAEGIYEVLIKYKNYDFYTSYTDQSKDKIWMGEIKSNSIIFKIKKQEQ